MIYGIVLFAFLSFVFSSPRHRWLITGESTLSEPEDKICFLFGRYMRDAAILMALLWVFRPLEITYLYWGAGGLFFLRTLYFLFRMFQILLSTG